VFISRTAGSPLPGAAEVAGRIAVIPYATRPWEQDGSGGRSSGAVRRGRHDLSDVSDVREPCGTAASLA